MAETPMRPSAPSRPDQLREKACPVLVRLATHHLRHSRIAASGTTRRPYEAHRHALLRHSSHAALAVRQPHHLRPGKRGVIHIRQRLRQLLRQLLRQRLRLGHLLPYRLLCHNQPVLAVHSMPCDVNALSLPIVLLRCDCLKDRGPRSLIYVLCC